LPPPTPPRTQPYSIACEGRHDQSFFAELCKVRGLSKFHVDQAGGNTQFGRYLEGLVKSTGVVPLEAVLVVGDNNGDPDKSFKEIRKQIQEASNVVDVGVPSEPFELATKGTSGVATVVMMIPFDLDRNPLPGCLESVLYDAAHARVANLCPCVDEFRDRVAESHWNASRHDKMRFRSLIAACCEDPHLSVCYAVHTSREIVDLSHSSLTGIIQFLEKFDAWLKQERRLAQSEALRSADF